MYAMLACGKDRTDWARVDAKTEAALDRDIAIDPGRGGYSGGLAQGCDDGHALVQAVGARAAGCGRAGVVQGAGAGVSGAAECGVAGLYAEHAR